MITFKVTRLTDNLTKREQKLYKSSAKLAPHMAEYIYIHLDNSLDRAIKKIRDNYIYKKLTRDTGKLGKSMTPYKRKINQYALEIGLWFDKKIAPHAATQIPYDDRGLTIINMKGKMLTVPIKGTPADIRGSRMQAAGHWLTPVRNVLYKTYPDTPYFKLRESVAIPQRIYTGTVRQYISDPTVGNMAGSLNMLARKAVKDAIAKKII